MTINQILPAEMLYHVLTFVSPADLGRCCRINEEWNQLASDDIPWKTAAEKIPWAAFAVWMFTPNNTLSKNIKASLKIFHSLHLNSFAKLFDHLESFLNQLRRGQNGELRCLAPGSDGQLQLLTIEIKGKSDRRSFYCDPDQSRITFNKTVRYIFSHDLNEEDLFPCALDATVVGHKAKSDTHKTQLIQNHKFAPFEGKYMVPLLKDRDLRKELERRITMMIFSKLSLLKKQEKRFYIVMLTGMVLSLITFATIVFDDLSRLANEHTEPVCVLHAFQRQTLGAFIIALAVFTLFPLTLAMIPNDK